MIKLPAYHFYEDRERLLEILNKENDHKYEMATRKPETELNTEFLTDKEAAEKEKLLSSGFISWTKSDFLSFVKGLEKYTRKGFREIAEMTGTKSESEVKAFSQVFWERGPRELEDWDKIERNVEKAEEMRRELEESMRLLTKATENADYYDDIVFEEKVYSKFKSRLYLEDHDKFLVFHAASLGLDAWGKLKEEVRNESAFELDAYIRSRAEGDLHKRIGQVVKFLKAQEEYLVEKMKEEKKLAKQKEKKMKERNEGKRDNSKSADSRPRSSNTSKAKTNPTRQEGKPKSVLKKRKPDLSKDRKKKNSSIKTTSRINSKKKGITSTKPASKGNKTQTSKTKN